MRLCKRVSYLQLPPVLQTNGLRLLIVHQVCLGQSTLFRSKVVSLVLLGLNQNLSFPIQTQIANKSLEKNSDSIT